MRPLGIPVLITALAYVQPSVDGLSREGSGAFHHYIRRGSLVAIVDLNNSTVLTESTISTKLASSNSGAPLFVDNCVTGKMAEFFPFELFSLGDMF